MYDSTTGMDFAHKRDATDNAIPEFFLEAQYMTFLSEQEGRPVYQDVEKVRIIMPGQRLSEVVEKVKDEHRRRWPQAYQAFKDGREAAVDGTPIEEWPPLSPAMGKNLKSVNIRTVEQLAALSDTDLSNIGMGARELRDKAKAWVQQAADGKPLAEAMAKNAQLQEELNVTRDTVKALQDAVAKLQAGANNG